MVLGCVLPDIHRGKVKAEGGDPTDQPAQHAVGDELPAGSHQGAVHHLQLAEQLLGIGIVEARLVGGTIACPLLSIDQPLMNEGTFLPVSLTGRQSTEALVHLRQLRCIGLQRLGQLIADSDQTVRRAQLARQLFDRHDELPERVLVLYFEDVEGDFGSHIRVSITVAPDPGAEMQRAGRKMRLRPCPAQLVVELVEQARSHITEDLIEVVEDGAGFVDGSRPLDPQFVRLPSEKSSSSGEIEVMGMAWSCNH